jgi:hypothetical protein
LSFRKCLVPFSPFFPVTVKSLVKHFCKNLACWVGKRLERVSLNMYYFKILYGNWHFMHKSIILYRFHIKWSIFTVRSHSHLTCLHDFDIRERKIFFTSVFLLEVFLIYWFCLIICSCSRIDCLLCLIFVSWHNCEVPKTRFYEENFSSSLHVVPAFCLIINFSVGAELCTHLFRVNTRSIQI